MAGSTLSAKSASPREVKRSSSAEESPGAGTASSMAALIVHRPSPESDTRPWKPLSAGSLMSTARSVRPSHPRRSGRATLFGFNHLLAQTGDGGGENRRGNLHGTLFHLLPQVLDASKMLRMDASSR